MSPMSNLDALLLVVLALALVGSANAGQLVVLDPPRSALVLPGLLDASLLGRGSFAFDIRQVHFDKLRVLGNVYPARVNGKLIRQAYLMKRTSQSKRSELPGAERDALRLEII